MPLQNDCNDVCVQRLLHSHFAPVYLEAGLDFKVTYVQAVHDVKAIVPDVFALKGVFGSRPQEAGGEKIEAPHSFKFCLRAGLSPTALNGAKQRFPPGVQPHADDVFMFVKQFMSDKDTGKATFIFPGVWSDESAKFCRRLSQEQGPLLHSHYNLCLDLGLSLAWLTLLLFADCAWVGWCDFAAICQAFFVRLPLLAWVGL